MSDEAKRPTTESLTKGDARSLRAALATAEQERDRLRGELKEMCRQGDLVAEHGEMSDEARYREALERAGASYEQSGVVFCGCGSRLSECDDMPADEPVHSSYFCAGRVARRVLTTPIASPPPGLDPATVETCAKRVDAGRCSRPNMCDHEGCAVLTVVAADVRALAGQDPAT
jgi:hypothetical protein